ncbi:hypothetical protein ACWGJP_05265 [Microbacterium sp. NPDC055903]
MSGTDDEIVTSRREARAGASGLPAAPPVQSAKARTRKVGGGWPLWAGAAGALIGAIVIAVGMLTPPAESGSPVHVEAAVAQESEQSAPTIPCPAFAGGEASSAAPSAACGRPSAADGEDAETDAVLDTDAESGDQPRGSETASPNAPGSSAPGGSDQGTTGPGASEPGTSTPGTSNPGTSTPGTSNPGTSTPGTSNPGTSTPGTSTPGTGTPGTTDPGTSNPGTTDPGTPTTPTNPPQPPAPDPLAFVSMAKEEPIKLLGISLFGKYILTVSGEPGSTATVWYGSAKAGTVTFGDNGRATITIGRSLINLGLSNPTIRVAYSDGTAGSEISARRDSI